jgi:hypothetical protein
MEIKGINVLEEVLQKYNGQDALISISHKLYGEQKIKLKIDYIFDEKRVGFRVKNGQEIFVYKNKIIDYGTKDGIYFADDLMKISIKLHRQ